MRKFNTQGIVLARTNYGEAARIITFLTPEHGKVKVMAKGVRKSKSKLAGGIELFSVSDIGVMVGKGEVDTLLSSRLVKHYGQIVKDLNRTNLAYQFIKNLDKATEDRLEAAYFELLEQAFQALDDASIDRDLIEAWFGAQLLRLAGHTPNLRTEKSGSKLIAGQKYDFDFEAMSFEPGKTYNSDHIKYLRLLFSDNQPWALQKVQGSQTLTKTVNQVVRGALANFVQA